MVNYITPSFKFPRASNLLVMATIDLVSKSTAIHTGAQSFLHCDNLRRPPCLNLKFNRPNVGLSLCYSLKSSAAITPLNIKPPKSEVDVQFQPNYEDRAPIWGILKKPAIALIVIVAALLSAPLCSCAASDGRIGGRAFRSSRRRSSSTSAPSRAARPRPVLSSSTSVKSDNSFTPEEEEEKENIHMTNMSIFMTINIFLLFILGICFSIYEYSYRNWMIWEVLRKVTSSDFGSEKKTKTTTTSVLVLQVGLLGTARSLQRDLNQIAGTACRSTYTGLACVLTEIARALLRHPDYCISANLRGCVKRSLERAEELIDQFSTREREVDNIRRHHPASLRAGGLNEYFVVTILVAVEGVHKMPAIEVREDLKNTLQKFRSIPCSEIEAVEVLWTPQAECDTLSEEQLAKDYPLLKPLPEECIDGPINQEPVI